MSVFGRSLSRLKERLRRLTLIELLAIVVIIAVLAAILIPPVKWASSGRMQIPVRVLVFDAATVEPILGAQVAVFWAPPVSDEMPLAENHNQYNPDHLQLRDVARGVTRTDGIVVINYEFRTGANDKSPTPKAHLRWAWVEVKAEGYGGVTVPVSYESQPTAQMRKRGELPVTVGLLPME